MYKFKLTCKTALNTESTVFSLKTDDPHKKAIIRVKIRDEDLIIRQVMMNLKQSYDEVGHRVGYATFPTTVWKFLNNLANSDKHFTVELLEGDEESLNNTPINYVRGRIY